MHILADENCDIVARLRAYISSSGGPAPGMTQSLPSLPNNTEFFLRLIWTSA